MGCKRIKKPSSERRALTPGTNECDTVLEREETHKCEYGNYKSPKAKCQDVNMGKENEQVLTRQISNKNNRT